MRREIELTTVNRPDLRELLEADAATFAAVILEVVRAECAKHDLVPPDDAAAITPQVTSGLHGVELRLSWESEPRPPA